MAGDQLMQAEKQIAAGKFDITDDLYTLSEATNKDGTVNVEIYDFDRDGDTVTVHFRTPTEGEKSETMPWPTVDSEDYKFVRICNNTVGGINAAAYLKIDGAEIKANNETWDIVSPESITNQMFQFEYTRGQVANIMLTGSIILWVCLMAFTSLVPIAYGLATMAGIVAAISSVKLGALFASTIVVFFVGLFILGGAVELIDAE